MRRPAPGLYLAHKPVGPSSYALLRERLGMGAAPHGKLDACHGGTLDPFAEGLLLILVGSATRLMERLHVAPKTYVAEVAWGEERDTGDLHGTVVSSGDPSRLTPELLVAALRPFLGWTEQTPPVTSAKKVEGEPAYRRVHRGEEVLLPPSRVYLHEARWEAHALPARSRLLLSCRGGFYVRALVRDLGRALGCGAHVAALARTRIGPWEDPGPGRPLVRVRGREVLPWAPAREVSAEERVRLKARGAIPRGSLLPPAWQPPEGYPPEAGSGPERPVLAVKDGELFALLSESEGGLSSTVWLSSPL